MSRSPRLRVRDAVSTIQTHSLPISITTTHDGHIRFRFFDSDTSRDRTITVANGRPSLLVPPVLARAISRGLPPPIPPSRQAHPPPPSPPTPPLVGVASAPLSRGADAPQPPRIRLFRALAHLRKGTP